MNRIYNKIIHFQVKIPGTDLLVKTIGNLMVTKETFIHYNGIAPD